MIRLKTHTNSESVIGLMAAKGVHIKSGEHSKARPVSPLIKASIRTALASINSN